MRTKETMAIAMDVNKAIRSRTRGCDLSRALRTAAFASGLALLGLTVGPIEAGAEQGAGDRWAAVGVDGTLLRSNGAVGVSHSAGETTYIVSFDRDVTDCICLATVEPTNGLVTTVGAIGQPTAIFVSTFTRKGVASPRGFDLHIVCD